MLDKDTRTAILALSRQGCGVRRIARELKLSRHSVRRVIQSGVTEPAMVERRSQLEEHLEEIRSFYEECQGNLVRVHEKLQEALLKRGQTLKASYSALTWFCRRQGIGVEEPVVVKKITTAPGLEMQHDTSPHQSGDRRKKGQAAMRQLSAGLFAHALLSVLPALSALSYEDFSHRCVSVFWRVLPALCHRQYLDCHCLWDGTPGGDGAGGGGV